MPCCPHCVEYFEPGGAKGCPVCGHPEACGGACASFVEPESRHAAARGLREAPRSAHTRLALLEVYVDPALEDFDRYTLEQRVRVQAAADRVRAEMPHGDLGFAARLARIYYDVRSQAKGAWLAGVVLAGGCPGDDGEVEHVDRLAWSCYHTRLDVGVAVDCYRRLDAYYKDAERDRVEVLECLARALEAAGRADERQTALAQAHALRAERGRKKRQQFGGALTQLRGRLESIELPAGDQLYRPGYSRLTAKPKTGE